MAMVGKKQEVDGMVGRARFYVCSHEQMKLIVMCWC